MSAIPRNEGESFEDYKERRRLDGIFTKMAVYGKMFWDSYYNGTYKNPDRAAIKLERKARKQSKGNN